MPCKNSREAAQNEKKKKKTCQRMYTTEAFDWFSESALDAFIDCKLKTKHFLFLYHF